MSLHLRLFIIMVALIIILILLQILRKGRVPVKYSLLWFFSSFLIMLVAIFPKLFGYISGIIGFQSSANMVIGVFIVILLFLTVMLTIIVSGQKEKITLLIQEVSMIKKELNKDNKKGKI